MSDNRVAQRWFDNSIKGFVIRIKPYRTLDNRGYLVEVNEFFQNGGMVSAVGARVKQNGEVYRRSQEVMVNVEPWVIDALNGN